MRDQPSVRKAMLCQVAVGRSYVADESSAERDSIPDGYDSFYIQDTSSFVDNKSMDKYEHIYYIKNTAQVKILIIMIRI